MADEDNLDVAIHHVERVLADQLNSVNSLSNKASVALGFVLTVFGALFSLSRDAIHAHLAAALISAGFLVVSAILLSSSYLVTKYDDPRIRSSCFGSSTTIRSCSRGTCSHTSPRPIRRMKERYPNGFGT